MPTNPSERSLTSRLYDDIVVGAFSFGAKLGEEQLVARYNTKRHILRDTFTQLEDLKLVTRVPNRGVFVREPHPDEVRELFEIRELLELQAARLTKLPAPPNVIAEMRKTQNLHSEAHREGRFRDVLRHNSTFHEIQYAACGNAMLAAAIADYATRTHIITSMKFATPALMENVVHQHLDIIDAMEGDSIDALTGAIRAHFDLARVEQYKQHYAIRHGKDAPREIEKPRARGIA
jgi:DNA-binding GntR family transcriptional regulator